MIVKPWTWVSGYRLIWNSERRTVSRQT